MGSFYKFLESYKWRNFKQAMGRKKPMHSNEKSELAKVLTTLDLTALGIGSTLGVGVYVLAGEAAKNYAGPAVIISFLIAAIASILSGLCYAEFGARVPKAGSAYVYSYVTIGEFMAFIIGWNLILEYVIGSASVVKGLFTYLDALLENAMSQFFREHMPMNVDTFGSFPDFFSLGVTLLFSVALAFGAKESSMVNNIFTVVNLGVVIFVIISGLWHVNVDNWKVPADKVPPKYGEGGFAPYGISGIIKGAATCFYGFIGFDCIATAGEEAKTPQKSIPIAIVVSLLVVFLAYFGISTVLTMILPYYEQDANAPFPHIYDVIGWPAAKYAVSVGAMCGLFSSLLGAMFPLPRIIYAMAHDGLVFKFLAKIHPRFKTPFVGTLLAGLFTGLLSCVFELEQLFKMMSIGTLLAYSMVAACILILRYDIEGPTADTAKSYSMSEYFHQMVNRKLKTPTVISARLVILSVIIYFIACFGIGGILSQYSEKLSDGEAWAIVVLTILLICVVGIMIMVSFQPKNPNKLTFEIPLVPWIPCISILINTYLMTMLDGMTWIRFVIWIVIGLAIYFLYGIWSSIENPSNVRPANIDEQDAKKHAKEAEIAKANSNEKVNKEAAKSAQVNRAFVNDENEGVVSDGYSSNTDNDIDDKEVTDDDKTDLDDDTNDNNVNDDSNNTGESDYITEASDHNIGTSDYNSGTSDHNTGASDSNTGDNLQKNTLIMHK